TDGRCPIRMARQIGPRSSVIPHFCLPASLSPCLLVLPGPRHAACGLRTPLGKVGLLPPAAVGSDRADRGIRGPTGRGGRSTMVPHALALGVALLVGQARDRAPDEAAWLKSVPDSAAVVLHVRGVEAARDDLIKMLKAMSPTLAEHAEQGLE